MRLELPGRLVLWSFVTTVVGGAAAVLASSERAPDRGAWLAFAVGVSFALCGLIAWYRRPFNRTGFLMTAAGVAWLLAALQFAGDSLLYTAGLAVSLAPFALFAHLVLAFPSGRLRSLPELLVVGAVYVDVVLIQLVLLLFADPPVVFDCSGCPPNALGVSPSESVYDAVLAAQRALGILVVVGGVTLLVRRWGAASPAYRRVLAPVVWTSGAVGVVLAASLVAGLLASDARRILWHASLAALISVPAAFLAGLVRARLAQASIGRLVVELGETAAPGELRDGLARALGDPALQVAYWLPESGSYVDVDGRPFALPDDAEGQVATVVELAGRRVAALVHDASLRDHPELVDAVCAAAGLALENERLQAALRSRLDELAAERDFIAAVVETAETLVIVLDPYGRIVRFNRACERLSGWSSEEVTGRDFAEILLPDDERERVGAALAAVREGGYPSGNRNHWVTRDGRRRLIQWMNTALTDADGAVEYVVASGHDITEQMQADAELRRLHGELELRLVELRASRTRIVEAADRERRRLERNLHDGAQQHFVAMTLNLRMAQAKLATDPAAAAELLERVTEELGQGLDELRELARGIHPVVLTERGLTAAVERLVERIPVAVELDVALEERLPEPVEAAAYYIVAEAVANVGRYANASAVRIGVERRNGAVLVEVADDGNGGADPARGSGLRGLADRVEALDGLLEVESPPGEGTRVRATIPVRSHP